MPNAEDSPTHNFGGERRKIEVAYSSDAAWPWALPCDELQHIIVFLGSQILIIFRIAVKHWVFGYWHLPRNIDHHD
jgi:hypothetical protein